MNIFLHCSIILVGLFYDEFLFYKKFIFMTNNIENGAERLFAEEDQRKSQKPKTENEPVEIKEFEYLSSADRSNLEDAAFRLVKILKEFKPQTIVYVASKGRPFRWFLKGVTETINQQQAENESLKYREAFFQSKRGWIYTDGADLHQIVSRAKEILDTTEPPYLFFDDYVSESCGTFETTKKAFAKAYQMKLLEKEILSLNSRTKEFQDLQEYLEDVAGGKVLRLEMASTSHLLFKDTPYTKEEAQTWFNHLDPAVRKKIKSTLEKAKTFIEQNLLFVGFMAQASDINDYSIEFDRYYYEDRPGLKVLGLDPSDQSIGWDFLSEIKEEDLTGTWATLLAQRPVLGTRARGAVKGKGKYEKVLPAEMTSFQEKAAFRRELRELGQKAGEKVMKRLKSGLNF